MKLRLPTQLRKVLMFCMVSCTVQATMPEDAASRTGVWYVCPRLEPQGLDKSEVAPAEAVPLESLLGSVLTEVQEVEEPDGTVLSANGMMMYTGELCYMCPELKLCASPDETSLTGVTFGHTRQSRKKGKTFVIGDSMQDRAERAMFSAIAVALGEIDGEYEEVIFVEHRGKGVVRRKTRSLKEWPLGMWAHEADFFGHHADAYHYFHDGYQAVWIGAHQIVYVPREDKDEDGKNSTGNGTGTGTGTGGNPGSQAIAAPAFAPVSTAFAPTRVASAAPRPVISGDDTPSAPAIKDSTGYHWSATNGPALAWSSTAWDTEAYTNTASTNVFFDDSAGSGAFTATLGGNVTVGKVVMTGDDDYTIDLNGNTLTLAGQLWRTGSGHLQIEQNQTGTFAGGDLVIKNGKLGNGSKGQIIADNITLENVEIDFGNTTSSSTVNGVKLANNPILLDTNGTFTMSGGSGSIYKINADNDAKSENTKVTITNKADLELTRTSGGSALETNKLIINGQAKLRIDIGSAKVHNVEVSGEGSMLQLKAGLLRPNPDSSPETLTTTITLDNKATLKNGSSSALTLVSAQKHNLSLTLTGDSSYLEGDWVIDMSKFGTLKLGGTASYLTVRNNLDLTTSSTSSITFDLSAPGLLDSGNGDFILFQEGENGTLKIDNAALVFGTDYLSKFKTVNVKLSDTETVDAYGADYRTNLFYSADGGLVLRFRTKDYVSDQEYHWDNSQGGTLAWSQLVWDNVLYDTNAPVWFETDGVEGGASTRVDISTNIFSGAITVTGEDDFTFNTGTSTLNAPSLGKSGSGTLTLTGNGAVNVEALTISEGTLAAAGNVTFHADTLTASGEDAALTLGNQTTTVGTLTATDGAAVTLGSTAKLTVDTLEMTTGASLTLTGTGSADKSTFTVADASIDGATLTASNTKFTVSDGQGISFSNGATATIGEGAEFTANKLGVSGNGTLVTLDGGKMPGSCEVTVSDNGTFEILSSPTTPSLGDVILNTGGTLRLDVAEINVRNVTLDHATIVEVPGAGTTGEKTDINIAENCAFVMDGGSLTLRRLNAKKDGSSITIQGGAQAHFTRYTSGSIGVSSVESPVVTISGEGTDVLVERCGVKTTEFTVENGATVRMNGAVFIPYRGAATDNDPAQDLLITLKNGAVIHNADTSNALVPAHSNADGSTSTLTATGTTSYLTGDWLINNRVTLDASTDAWSAITIGGADGAAGKLTVDAGGFILDLGDKWDGATAMAAPVALFHLAENGTLKIGSTTITGDETNCLRYLNALTVRYGADGETNAKLSNEVLNTKFYVKNGTLYFTVANRGEYVWSYGYGPEMAWNNATWNGDDYDSGANVRFISNGDDTEQEVHISISTDAEHNRLLQTGSFLVDSEDVFVFDVDGTIISGAFVKDGRGYMTINAATPGATPVFQVDGNDFTINGGRVTLNSVLKAVQGSIDIDGTGEDAASLVDQYAHKYVDANHEDAVFAVNLENAELHLHGAKASADLWSVGSPRTSGNNNSVLVEDGATLTLRCNAIKAAMQVHDLTISGQNSQVIAMGREVRAANITVKDGGALSLNTGLVYYSWGQATDLLLENGGNLRNTGSGVIKLNDIRRGTSSTARMNLTLSGATPSVLEGDWSWDASLKSVISYADASSAALTIRNGTFNIFNTTTATETDALTIDLSSHWDGDADITRRILRFGSGGVFNVNGQSVAAGDITSLFNNVYVRYTDAEGRVQTINLSSPEALNHPEHYYQLLWENNSLFFTSSSYDENGPFEWRHSYEELYGTRNPDETLTAYQLTWKHGGEWHPDSHNYDGPTTGNPNALIYRNEHAVSFVGDTDEVVDTVHVTIDGTVAPGDFVHGVAGVRVTGADNFVFEGVNGATIADVTIDKEVSTSSGLQTVKEIKTPTTLSKSGTGTLTIAANVKLDYTGRTEVLGGKMELLGAAWTPAGTVVVAEGATLQVGDSDHMGSMSTNVFTIGTNMVENNGYIQTNIVHTTGSTVTGEGTWDACYYLLEKSNFHAGIVELPALVGSSIRASFVLNNGDAAVSRYFAGAGQNITLMNRGFMTVGGTHGATNDNAAVEAYNVIITGQGSGLDFTGKPAKDKTSGAYTTHATVRAQTIDLTHGATLGLVQELEHVGDNKLTFTLGYGSTVRNNGTSTIVLNPNANAQFDLIVKASDTPNYFQGNWKVDLSHPFLLDYSNFDNQTVVVPIHIMDGTMTLANADSSKAADGLSNFIFRVDGLKYDTYEIMTVGERGKIALSTVADNKEVSTVLVNDTDYFSHLKSMGYIFHVDAKGQEVGWRYVDIVQKTTLEGARFNETTGELLGYTRVKTLTDAEFAALTGFDTDKGINFSLLYESNILSLVISPDGPVGDRQFYFWSGRSDSGATTGAYDTWTRHNSTELSPWSDDEIFQNGYLTIFADVDIHGRKIGSYTVEVQNSVATGSKPLEGPVREGFATAAIHFDNHSVANYTIQSDKYDGSGYIADLYEYDGSGNPTVDVTKVIVNGGFVEIKTSNTYGGKLAQSAAAQDPTTIVQSVLVGAGDCDSVPYELKNAQGDVIQTSVKLSDLGVADARAAHLVNYSRYTYAYQDATGVHFITNSEYETGKYADKNPERVYITQRADGSNLWSVRGNTIPMTMKDNLAVVYETDVLYGYAFTETDSQNKTRLHFVSAQDYASGKYADKNVMEVVLTPTESNRVSWSITGSLNGSDFQESVAQSRLDMDLVQKSTSTYAFAYKNPADANHYEFITEQQYKLWNAWTEASEANKASCFTALQNENAKLAAFAAANPNVLVEQVSVVRTVDSSNPAEIRWTVGGEGGQVVNFQEFPFNQVYAYKLADNSVHVLTKTEQEAWLANPSASAFGHDVQRVGVFGPVNNQWGLYTVDEVTGNKEQWGVIYERPEVYNSTDAYMRTTELHTAYAYVTTSAGSSDLNHAHLISEQEYNAWKAWLAIDGEANPLDKEAAYNALLTVSPDLAAVALANPTVSPEPVSLTRYENEQTYRVTGSAIHDNLSTQGVANNFSYAYTTTVHDGESGKDVQQINFLTESQYKAWRSYNAVLTDKTATADQKDAAFAAFSTAVGSELATSIRDSAVLAPERVDLAYFTQTDNANGSASRYWAVRGDNITGRVDTLEGNMTYGSAFICVYKDTSGQYHAISQEDYQNWKDGKVDAISDTAVKNFASTHTGVDAAYTYTAADTALYTLSEADCTALQGGDISGISDPGLRVLARTYTGTASGYAYKDGEGDYHALSQADFDAWNAGDYAGMADADAKAFAEANTGSSPVYSIQGAGNTGYLSQDDYAALQGGYYTNISGDGLQAIAQTHTATGGQAYLGGDWQSYTLSQADYNALQEGKYADISASGLLVLARTHTGTASGYAYKDGEGNYHALSQADFDAWNAGDYAGIADADAKAFAEANTGSSPVYSIQGAGDHVGYLSQDDYAAFTSGNLTTLTASGYQALAESHTGAISMYSYVDANGAYHTISEADYTAWQAGNITAIADAGFKAYANAHSLVNPLVVDMHAESSISGGASTTQWSLTTQDGTTLTFEQVGDIATLSGKVYSYAYTNVDSLGRTHVHFISAEDYANGTYKDHNPLLVTLSNTGTAAPTYSWGVRGTTEGSSIDDSISTRSIANNYAYAYKTVDGEGREQINFITAAEYRSWNAGDHGGIQPERVDLSFYSSTDDYGVETTWWQLKGATIDTRMDTLAGEKTYGAAFLYAYKDAQDQYHVLSQADFNAWNSVEHGGIQAERLEMIAESVILHAEDGTPYADTAWVLRTIPGEGETGETIQMSAVGGMQSLNGKVYAYAYRNAENGTLQFITAADYWDGVYDDLEPECVALTMTANTTQPWNIQGGGIDVIVDVSDIPVNTVTDVYTDTKTEHYTYIVVVRGEDGQISGQFVSERDVKDGKFPEGALRGDDGSVNVQRLTLVQQADGKWFVPEKGYTMAMEAVEVSVDTTQFFGYGYYDAQGRLHLTTQDAYYADNGSGVSGLDGYKTELGNTQLIRLAYDETAHKWYIPGVLIASNEHALGTSEVKIGYGSRLLATTNLFVTSLTTESGANVIARQNLDVNKPLIVASGAYFEVDGKLTAPDITVEGGAVFKTNDVTATNVTILSGAKWDLSSFGTSVLDISDRLIIHGGAEISGNALMRDGLLELVAGNAENPYVTVTGTLQLGVDATLDLTKLMPEGEGHHYTSPLRVSEGGRIILEPHDGVLLSMNQVNHLLMDHVSESGHTIDQNQHVMHIATLGAGANFSLLESYVDDNGYLQSKENPLPTIATDNYDTVPANVELAEGLGYLLNAAFIRRHVETGSDAGLDEVVLHLSVKEDAPAYVWDGIYNGRGHAENNNIWCMYNGAEDMGDLEHAKFAWSGKAVYGDPDHVSTDNPYLNWGQEVYFLEVGFDKHQKGAFTYHYVNEGDKAATDLTNRAKYVDISGDVWSRVITVDVDRLYDMTLDQYLRNVGYMFYSSDETGTITDAWYDPATGGTYALSSMSAEAAAAAGYERQATNIIKAGTGVLTLNTENSFSGTVYLNSGSVFSTNEKGLGTSHVKMMDGTGLYINFLFEMKGDSAYRNPVLPNEITVWGGENFEAQAERTLEGSQIVAVTIGYNPISVVDVMSDLRGDDTSQLREESTSRHWRTLSITGPLHGDKNTEITLQGYTSYTGGVVYTSMFYIYGSEDRTDFSGVIKLQNYRNISPAAYSSVGNTFMNDTNEQRGTGALELMLSDATLQYATLDLTRANVLASYTKDDRDHSQGYGRRQTPTHIVLLRGDSAVAGLNADFLGTIVRAQRDAQGTADSNKVEILVATQAQELASVRTIATGNYSLSLHSEDRQDFVYSGVLGGKYAYAGEGSGTIPESGDDASPTSARLSNGMISLLHTGDGAQYIHTGYLQDLTIGNEQGGSYAQASGGTVGFHYLDLQGNLTLHSGSTLKLDVDDCVRTAVQTGDPVAVHWDESAFSSDNVVIHAGKQANIITTHTTTATAVPDLSADGRDVITHTREVPLGSNIVGSLTVDNGSYLNFYSRGIEPLPVVEGHTSADWAQQMTNPAFHPEAGVAVTAPETGYFLDITGALIIKGDVHVDFAGVEFDSAKNGVTYFLARAQKGLIGTVNQQTISLGNGYYGVIRGLETYDRKVTKVELPGNAATYVPPTDPTSGVTNLSMDSLTEVRVNLTPVADSTDYFFNYTTYFMDENGVETSKDSSLTLTQVSGNVYHYDVNGNSYEAVLLYTYDALGNVTSTAARMNLISLAYQDNAGYIIMTVTNTPPRVWFNTDNVIDPTSEIGVTDGATHIGALRIMVTPDGTKYINASDANQYDGALGFGDTTVDTVWTPNGPAKASWIDSHLAFEPGCRVQFNKYGVAAGKKLTGE